MDTLKGGLEPVSYYLCVCLLGQLSHTGSTKEDNTLWDFITVSSIYNYYIPINNMLTIAIVLYYTM